MFAMRKTAVRLRRRKTPAHGAGRSGTTRAETTRAETTRAERKPGVAGARFRRQLHRGRPVRAGRPVEMREFDRERETIVLAFDPARTPAPSFALLDGLRPGEKILTMNGAQVLRIADAQGLTMADLNIVEADLGP